MSRKPRNGRELAFATFPHRCDECGFWGDADNPLHAHHIDFDPLNNAVTNLRILCRSCHWDQHRRIPRADAAVLVIGVPLSMKRWVEDQARRRNTTQADIVNEALQEYRERVESKEERKPVELAS